MNLTTRQVSLLVASIEGSMNRMPDGCPMHDEVNELYYVLMGELIDRTVG